MHELMAAGFGITPLVLAALFGRNLGGEAQPEAAGAGILVWWLIGLAGVAVILNQVAGAWRNMTGRFQEKESPHQYRKREDCLQIHAGIKHDITALRNQSEQSDTALRLEVKEDIGGIHRRIDGLQTQFTGHSNKVVGAVERLGGKIDQMNAGGANT